MYRRINEETIYELVLVCHARKKKLLLAGRKGNPAANKRKEMPVTARTIALMH
jgi:hypothetical protein